MLGTIAALSLTSLAAPSADSPATAYAEEGYELVWTDEFETDGRPNANNWGFEEGFSRNKEAQWYQPDNASVRDGLLVIEARRERKANPNFDPAAKDWKRSRKNAWYTSSSLTTRGKHTWLYGRFELRAKPDPRAGLWPAWWTVGAPESRTPWPACGEIDMMEYYRGMILANACWKKQGGGRWAAEWDSTKTPLETLGGEAWSKDFHTWRMDWDEDSIDLYLDGQLLNTIDTTKTINPDGTNPFNWPHLMIINLAIGGQQGGKPAETEFPARYEIDWVRVYQKTESVEP